MVEIFYKVFIDELLSIKNSFYKFSLISILPIFCFVLVIAIFYDGVVRDIPIVVVDNDKSKLSKRVLFKIHLKLPYGSYELCQKCRCVWCGGYSKRFYEKYHLAKTAKSNSDVKYTVHFNW